MHEVGSNTPCCGHASVREVDICHNLRCVRLTFCYGRLRFSTGSACVSAAIVPRSTCQAGQGGERGKPQQGGGTTNIPHLCSGFEVACGIIRGERPLFSCYATCEQVEVASDERDTRHHYLKGLEGCSTGLLAQVQAAFEDLYGLLRTLLEHSLGTGQVVATSVFLSTK